MATSHVCEDFKRERVHVMLPFPTAWHALKATAETGPAVDFVVGDERPTTVSRASLLARACGVGDLLRKRGLKPGGVVVTLLPTGIPLVCTLLGTWSARGTTAPLAHAMNLTHPGVVRQRMKAILEVAKPAVIVASRETLSLLSAFGLLADGVGLVSEEEVLACGVAEPRTSEDDPQADDVAHLQFSSGSTGTPHGSALRHRHLVANVAAIGERVEVRSDDRFVSWLPLHHDMGFIGGLLCPLQWSIPLRLVSTELFIRDPYVWLRQLSEFRASLSPAPTFAYAVLARRAYGSRLEGIDLSRWRYAWVGAEPIFEPMLAAFEERFAAVGLGPNTLRPCYGLAEASLAVSLPAPGVSRRVERADREIFRATGRAVPPKHNSPGVSFVGCGSVVSGLEVRVVRPDGVLASDGTEGTVHMRGASVADAFVGLDDDPLLPDGWVDTGDMGFLKDGELFLSGRAKDLVIRGGVNIQPQDIEHAAEAVPGVRLGRSVAFSVIDPEAGREEVVLVVEHAPDEVRIDALELEVRRSVSAAVGVMLDRVVWAAAGKVPKTTSGKVQRSLCRTLFLEGALDAR